MKKLVLIALLAITVSVFGTSCKSRKGTCPAYSEANEKVLNSNVG